MFDYRSMFDLTGKTALLVGAGSGIGEATSHGLAVFGATVFCADVDAGAAEKLRSNGGRGEAVELEIRDSGSVRTVAERVGTPDVLVSTPSINSDASSYVTGAFMLVDGGWTAADGRSTPPL